MNHRLNAKAHNYPECPECGASKCEPCVEYVMHGPGIGRVRCDREAHTVRKRMAGGGIVVVAIGDARARRVLRPLRKVMAATTRFK